MTVAEIWEEAVRHFGEDPTGKFHADGGMWGRRFVNRVYQEICREAKCARTSGIITTTAGAREVELPPDCVALEKVVCKPNGYTVGHRLERIRIGEAEEEAVGPPYYYYQAGPGAIGIVPLPDAAYPLSITYYKGPVEELSTNDTPSLVPEDWIQAMIFGVVYHLSRVENGENSQAAAKWRLLYQEELKDMKRYIHERCNADQYAGVS